MLMKIVRSTLLLALLHAGPVLAASFDCAKAGTPIEKMTCTDPDSSALEAILARVYQQVSSESPNAEQHRKAHAQWRENVLEHCTNSECLQQAYASRINQIADTDADVMLAAMQRVQQANAGQQKPYYKLDHHRKALGAPKGDVISRRGVLMDDRELFLAAGRPVNDDLNWQHFVLYDYPSFQIKIGEFVVGKNHKPVHFSIYSGFIDSTYKNSANELNGFKLAPESRLQFCNTSAPYMYLAGLDGGSRNEAPYRRLLLVKTGSNAVPQSAVSWCADGSEQHLVRLHGNFYPVGDNVYLIDSRQELLLPLTQRGELVGQCQTDEVVSLDLTPHWDEWTTITNMEADESLQQVAAKLSTWVSEAAQGCKQ